MRQIKFRVWDSKEKTWIWNLGMKKNNVLCDGTESGRFEIMQFTGLYDKNGKEIYEYDIIQATVTNENRTGIYIVEYDAPAWWADSQKLDLDVHYIDGIEIKDYKVIGNKFDNPELL